MAELRPGVAAALRRRRSPLPCVVVLALLGFVTAAPARTITINANGTGDFPSLRAAITAAQSGDIIILEQGTYVGPDNRNLTFSGKSLTVRSREPDNPAVVAATVLDCQGTSGASRRAFDFSSSDETTRLTLAGLTIRNGYGQAISGAVSCEEADLEAIHCTFESNRSQEPGGAISCRDNTARFEGCTFTNNASDSLRGGTLYATGSQLTFVGCSFHASIGCALETYDCRTTLTGCAFQNNKGREGGAIRSDVDTNPSAFLTLTNCTFAANSATSGGGALYNHGIQATVNTCTFTANTTGQDGGAIYNYGAGPTLLSCLFVGNTATGSGGALHDLAGSKSSIRNCTLVANSAASGGALAAKGGCAPLLSHSILWDNTATQGSNIYLGNYQWSDSETKATVEFCDVEGGRESAVAESGCALLWSPSGNLSSDPFFLEGDNGDYHLAPDSACINAGDPTYAPPAGLTDLDGAARRAGSAVDLGAYEFQGLGPVYRLWSPAKNRHIYTTSPAERDAYVNQAGGAWQLERVPFYAFYVPVTANLLPVHHFFSRMLDAHFYTLFEDERQAILRTWPEVWAYEGVAFYAYPQGRQPLGTLPMYRFWSGVLNTHLFTINEQEKDAILGDASSTWAFEGVAWYAYATPRLLENAAYEFTGGPQEATCALTLSAMLDGRNAQLSVSDIALATSSTWMRMTLDFNRQTTTLNGFRVQAATASATTIKVSGAGVTIPLTLSLQASFETATPLGPYYIDPTTGVFADFTSANQNLTVTGPIFRYDGAVQFDNVSEDIERQAATTYLEMKASGTFERLNRLPDGIDARMPSTFRWYRPSGKDLLAEVSVDGHSVQLYVAGAEVTTQGLWKGKMAP